MLISRRLADGIRLRDEKSMIYAFHVRFSFAVMLRLDDEERAQIAADIVTQAEKLNLGTNDHAIFDIHGYDLKAVINFPTRIIRILTLDEAQKSGVPEPPSLDLGGE